jgi:hypothetical protein
MWHEAIAMPTYVPIFSIDLTVGFLKTGKKYSLSKLLIIKELCQMVVMETNSQGKNCLGIAWCLIQLKEFNWLCTTNKNCDYCNSMNVCK